MELYRVFLQARDSFVELQNKTVHNPVVMGHFQHTLQEEKYKETGLGLYWHLVID